MAMNAPRQHTAARGAAIVAAAGRWSESRWLFPAVLAAVVGGLFCDALVPGSVFAYRDSAHFYPPLYRLVIDEWLSGRVPLWNALLNCGQPLAGSATSGAFYPPQLLVTALLPDGLSLNVLAIAHLAWAACGGYRLARIQHCSRLAATLAAITYAFCGSVLFQIYNPIYAAGAAWMAWAVVGGWRLLDGAGFGSFILLAVSLAMSVLAGDPQSGYHAGLIVCAIWCWRPRTEAGWRPPIGRLPIVLLAAGVAGLLALVQIVPAAEFAAETSRSMGVAPHSIWDVPGFLMRPPQSSERARWYDILIGRPPRAAGHYLSTYLFSVPPWRAIEAVWPGFAGGVFHRWTTIAGIEAPHVWVGSLYAGLVPGVVALAGCSRRAMGSRVWLTCLLASGLASLGGYCGVGLIRNGWAIMRGAWDEVGYRPGDEVGGMYWILSVGLPGYAGFRYPAKWLTVCGLGFAQLAGLGFDQLADPGVRPLTSRRMATIGGLLGAALLGLTAAVILRGPTDVVPCESQGVKHPEVVWRVLAGGTQAVVVAAAAWLVLRRRWDSSLSPAAGMALLAVAGLDLVAAGCPLVLTGRYADLAAGSGFLVDLARDRDPAIAALSPLPRVAAGGSKPLVPLEDSAHHLQYIGMTMVSHVPWLHDWAKVGEASTSLPADFELLCSPLVTAGRHVVPRRFYDLCGVELFVVPNEAQALTEYEAFLRRWSEPSKAEAAGVSPEGGELPIVEVPLRSLDPSKPLVYVARNESALPRVRIVREFVIAPAVTRTDFERYIDLLKRIAFPNPLLPDLVRTAVVELASGTTGVCPAAQAIAGERPGADSVRLLHDDPQLVVIEASLATSGMVVLADTFHRDWSLVVQTGGQPATPWPVHRVNHVHRGCGLPAGRHVLEYRYHSRSFAWAWPISVGAWIGVAVACGVLLRRSPPARRRAESALGGGIGGELLQRSRRR